MLYSPAGFTNVKADLERSIRKGKTGITNLNAGNTRALDLWFRQIRDEEKAAKGRFENVHQWVQAGLATRTKLEKQINICQKELVEKVEENVQRRKNIKYARKWLEKYQLRNKAMDEAINAAHETTVKAKKDFEAAEAKRKGLLHLYEEHLGLRFQCDKTGIIILFTRISPENSDKIYKATLKKQRSRFTVTTKPCINIPKSYLDELNNGEWLQFLNYVRGEFHNCE